MKNTLIVIDAQKVYFNRNSELRVQGGKAILERINKLITAFTEKNIPIVYIRHIHKADGSDLGRMFDFTGQREDPNFLERTDEVEFEEGLLVEQDRSIQFVKTRYSSFSSADFVSWLHKNKISKLTICGFMTNFCCESTARDAHTRDYYVDFVIDATGCPDLENLSQAEIKKASAETLRSGFAKVLTTREAVKIL